MTKGYVSYKDKYNTKYEYKKNESHTLEEISKDTGVSMKGLQQIYNKGIGAYKTNPQSVRPNVKSKEQWAMARVYSSVMGGKASNIDSAELKMEKGGLIAPNGKKSNLTPLQYKLVRTPAFIQWFGDWEKDPANASKVIDSNGEPLVVFHYSKNDFNIFNAKGKIEVLGGIDEKGDIIPKIIENYGMYFTDNIESRNFYLNKKGKYEYKCFINIKNPYFTDDYRWSMLINEERFTFLQENKFDGVISTKTIIEYVTLAPNQIKLADGTNKTFDGSNPDIRFERGGRAYIGEPIEFYQRTHADGTIERFSVEDYEKNIYPSIEKKMKMMETGGNVGQEITCQNCGWHWNTKDSKDFDKYVCHKCDYDNSPFYSKGGMALNTQTGNNWYSKGGMQRKFAEGGLVPRRNPKGDVILEDAWLITRDEYNKQNLTTHLPKGTKADKATLKLQEYFAQITNGQHTSKVNEAIKKGLYIEAVNSGKMTRQRANEIISSIGNTKDLISMNETKKQAEGGKITQFEIEAMRNYINGTNPNPKLKDSFEKVLRKFGVEVERSDLSNFNKGKYTNPYDFSGYEYMRKINEEAGVSFLLTGEYQLVSKAIYEKDYAMWLFYSYLGRINISFKACQDWLKQAQEYFEYTMPIPIVLQHAPNAKDGRSYAMWYATNDKAKAESKIGRKITFQYNDRWYYQEIGMVGNFDDKKSEGWGSLYREKKTGLLIPEYTETSFHFNTLIHEFSHCLDFQTQLLKIIDKYDNKKAEKLSGVIQVNTETMSDAELALYATQLSEEAQKDNVMSLPITNHFDEFVDALIRALRACASGNIPLTQLYEQQALDVQQALGGVYGDLLLEQRERKAKERKEVEKADELREDKRFTWQGGSFIGDIKDYAIQNALQADLKSKLQFKRKENYTLSEIIEFDNLITGYFNTDYKKFMLRNPSKATERLADIKKMKQETNRLINNHYDNIKSGYEYGFSPNNELELYIAKNCRTSDFRDYKSWKECVKEKLQGFE